MVSYGPRGVAVGQEARSLEGLVLAVGLFAFDGGLGIDLLPFISLADVGFAWLFLERNILSFLLY